ncbi:MAG: UvrD-helicase domain-containing protein [Spirochaetaceae bacterium]|nr:UvrD-helicase domain-containing protein [Spirochaetaceae bacterium]
MAERGFKELISEQKKAIVLPCNVIVAAGAGSGKTSVLSARFVHLIVEKGFRVEEILTLTFTNKATNEMYERIYHSLSKKKDNKRAERAITDFHKAKIRTIDSFCADIARLGASYYGVSPDFKSDNEAIIRLAKESALSFVLDNRENEALQIIIADKNIQTIAEDIFAKTVLQYSSISSPLDFDQMLSFQIDMLITIFKDSMPALNSIIDGISSELNSLLDLEAKFKNGKARLKANEVKTLENLLYIKKDFRLLKEFCMNNKFPPLPDIAKIITEKDGVESNKLIVLTIFLSKLCSINNLQSSSMTKALNLKRKELLKLFEETIAPIANYFLQTDTIRDVFTLLKKFQNEFNKTKRLTGLLTFNDIAHLAVDILKNYPDIRKMYKNEIKAIMIDEFQDNNELQRDLIFLIAEKEGRNTLGLPETSEISIDKMFFVGDEKQSIYRFRGADVSVFKSLNTLIPAHPECDNIIELKKNFRSKKVLIDIFNHIFDSVFKPIHGQAEAYEAEFKALECGRTEIHGITGDVQFCLLQKNDYLEEAGEGIDEFDVESAYIAEKIQNLIKNEYKVTRRGKFKDDDDEEKDYEAPCVYEDFAILVRKKKQIRMLEKYLKKFGVPHCTEEPVALWKESVINDIIGYLRCIVYPDDKLSFASVLRSPFVRLNDKNFAVCLLNWKKKAFAEADYIEGDEDKERYKTAQEKYHEFCVLVKKCGMKITDVITRIWYDEGYRFETLYSYSAQKYSEIYDYFFDIARRFDEQGKNIAEFIDEIELKKSGSNLNDKLEIPIERNGGVKIMTIHKSKGLQFPIVFVPFCGADPRENTAWGIVYYKKLKSDTKNEQNLLMINLPLAKELNEKKIKNFFLEYYKQEEKKMAIAEIKRLLYVAATRAESGLFFTASIPKITDSEEKNTQYDDTADSIEKRLLLFNDKKDKEKADKIKMGDIPLPNFLALLILPLVTACGTLYELKEIPAKTRKQIDIAASAYRARQGNKKSFAALQKSAMEYYCKAQIEDQPESFIEYKNSSSLDKDNTEALVDSNQKEQDDFDAFLKKMDISPAKFGEIAHKIIEDTLNGIETRIENTKIIPVYRKAEELAQKFFHSELGIKCSCAQWRKVEYPFMSLFEDKRKPENRNQAYPLKKTFIEGRIDLLFKLNDTIYIVDFKTNREINASTYKLQMASYKDAIKNLYPDVASIESYLFYLRYGKEVPCP